MSVELEWRFNDEVPAETPEESGGPRRPRWRRWVGLGVALAVLAGVGVYAWWRVRRDALAAVEAEVEAVAQLELNAIAEGDVELQWSLQDDADAGWYEAQRARAGAELLLPPPLPSLVAAPAVAGSARVVGDSARVEILRPAGLAGGDGATFRATRFYRRGDDGRWLHTRADLDTAGRVIVFSGEEIAITVFAIDAGWAEAAAYDLEGLAARFCGLASCRERAPLTLTFTDTLDTAPPPADALPAPFLVGAPGAEDGDEAARTMWRDGLRELAIDRLIAREGGRPLYVSQVGRLERPAGTVEGRQGKELFQARWREWMRAKLEVREPLLPDVERVAAALEAGELMPLGELWATTLGAGDGRLPLAEAQVDLFLSFVEEEYGLAQAGGLFHALNQAADFEAVVVDGLGVEGGEVERGYREYVEQVTGAAEHHGDTEDTERS